MSWKDWSLMMRLTLGIFIGSILFFCIVAYMAYWPVTVLEFKEKLNPYQPVYAGESMYYPMHLIKYREIAGTASKYLVNAKRTIHLETIGGNPKAGVRNTAGQVFIDRDVPPDRYKFRWVGSWQINFLHPLTKVEESDWFDVLPPRKK